MRPLFVLFALLVARPVRGQEPYTDLGTGDAERVASAIDTLSQQSDPLALSVLRALRDRSLKVSSAGEVYEVRREGMVNLRGGKAPASSSGLNTPVVNNMLRRSLARAIARLELTSRDHGTRLEASRVLASAPEVELADEMRAALDREREKKKEK